MKRTLIVLGVWLLLSSLSACSSTAVEVSSQPTQEEVAASPTSSPAPTLTPTEIPPTSTPTASPTPEPLPEQITDQHGTVMLLIPEGEFTMGWDQPLTEYDFPNGVPDEQPAHPVYVDAFYIDLLEVTNREYQDCVEDGACKPPHRTDCCTESPTMYISRPSYYGNPEYDDYPVIFISWYDARDYCDWRGARLATEAEWEKASRGTDARMFPWGNDDPTPDLLNFTWPPGEFNQRPVYNTTPVGSYPEGASPYGVLDLAGNVYEWVQDIYDPGYYEYSPYENPSGPEEGAYRVTRGGSFFNQAFRNRSSNRNNAYIPADSVHFDGGARCAMDVPAN